MAEGLRYRLRSRSPERSTTGAVCCDLFADCGASIGMIDARIMPTSPAVLPSTKATFEHNGPDSAVAQKLIELGRNEGGEPMGAGDDKIAGIGSQLRDQLGAGLPPIEPVAVELLGGDPGFGRWLRILSGPGGTPPCSARRWRRRNEPRRRSGQRWPASKRVRRHLGGAEGLRGHRPHPAAAPW